MEPETDSENVKRAKEIIKKYSYVFDALLEFEKTGKLPDSYNEVK
jgi:hypothetical protein